MNAAARILGFLLVLGAVFAVAFGVGRAVGPLGEETAPATHGGDGHAADGHRSEEDDPAPAVALPGGLAVSEGGYSLRLAREVAKAGPSVPVAFAVEGPDGAPVTAYDVEHGKRLHLIAVRRDLTGYQHVHPTLAEDGTWTTRLDLTPGSWRLFADFDPAGAAGRTLGADLSVAGPHRPDGEVPTTRTTGVDGYTVTVTGDLEPGAASRLTLRIERDGRPVTDLQPYLGAYGHLVVLREGDLAYLHVHPEGGPGDGLTASGPDVAFEAEVPSSGDHRLFLDFRHRSVVRTAELALTAQEAHP